MATDVGEEELQAVGGAGGGRDGCRLGRIVLVRVLLLGGCRRLRTGGRRADVQADSLELAGELFDVLVVQI